MNDRMNTRVLLKNHPTGKPTAADFQLEQAPAPEPGDGEILCRTIYLSLDPYMRGRMSGRESYTAPTPLGEVMGGGTVSQVVRSNNPRFSEGDFVLGYNGWQSYAVSDGSGLRKLDPADAPLSYALGVLGMPGMTAYMALLDVGRPQAGETVVVSAASGAVGSVVGQIAKIKGCRAVGLAGSDKKCDYVTEELGFDACINYKKGHLDTALREACPAGIDVYYDNVAGEILEAVLQQINKGARIPLVGLISQYNAPVPPPGPNLAPLLVKRAQIQGFLVSDYAHRENEFLAEVTHWLKEGRMKYREDIVDGLESAPEAFIGLFEGKNFGKLLVRVADDPTGRR
ncbi:MAG TPA: NADP-dependent oxidoreductase [Armatimonadota bacterium]|nr:NADP-dependent oxidoreductase [Armatimonadota bacterium]